MSSSENIATVIESIKSELDKIGVTSYETKLSQVPAGCLVPARDLCHELGMGDLPNVAEDATVQDLFKALAGQPGIGTNADGSFRFPYEGQSADPPVDQVGYPYVDENGVPIHYVADENGVTKDTTGLPVPPPVTGYD